MSHNCSLDVECVSVLASAPLSISVSVSCDLVRSVYK
jgi:hypothetical protein